MWMLQSSLECHIPLKFQRLIVHEFDQNAASASPPLRQNSAGIFKDDDKAEPWLCAAFKERGVRAGFHSECHL